MCRSLPLVLLSWIAAAAPAQEGSDTVVKVDGASVRGVEVVSFSLTSVKIVRGKDKEEVEIPPHQVADIHWGVTPDAFQSALAAMQRNDYDGARQLFGDAATATERVVLKAEARFLQGKAAAFAATADAAAAANAAGALRAWISEFGDNWRLPEAMFLLGRALRLGNLAGDAETTLKELDERAIRDGWGAIWSVRAKFELAMAQLGAGKALEARSAFQSAASAAENAMATSGSPDPEFKTIKLNAKVGEGETLVREKQFDRAADFFRTLSGNDDPGLAASGKAGEGEALYLQAADKKDPAQLRQAQIALASASVLDPGTGETSAKANYYLGKVLLALGERDGADFKTRANAYFQVVARSYPSSSWVGPAKAELAK